MEGFLHSNRRLCPFSLGLPQRTQPKAQSAALEDSSNLLRAIRFLLTAYLPCSASIALLRVRLGSLALGVIRGYVPIYTHRSESSAWQRTPPRVALVARGGPWCVPDAPARLGRGCDLFCRPAMV